jgi:predicted transcriptional regulator
MDHSSYYQKTELLKQLLLKEDQHDLKILAPRLNVSIRTAYRMIQDLKDVGYIDNYDRKKKTYVVI